MIKITFPDGSFRLYEPGITPFEIAQQISITLANNIQSCKVDGRAWSLTKPINYSCDLSLSKELSNDN